jgi:hypothetical protein
VVVVNSSMNDNTISVFIGQGDGTFHPQYQRPTLVAPSDVAIADFDQDGDRDVLITHGVSPAVMLFVNDGQGGLSPVVFNLGVTQGTPAVADLDGDGWLDVAVTTGLASVLVNDQAGGFTLQQGSAVASGGVGVADFDHDGDVDMVAADFYRSQAAVLLNDGAGHFTSDAVMSTGYQTGRCTGADFGKDALPEIVTANSRAGTISFVTNTTWTAPASARLVRGIPLAGGLDETKVSDDAYMVVRNPNPLFTAPQAVLAIVRFAAPAPTYTPASIAFTLEAHATTPDLVQRILLYDWAAGSWVEVDARPTTVADQVVEVPLTDPGRFLQPGTRTMTAEVRFGPNPAIGTWSAHIDRVAWTVR